MVVNLRYRGARLTKTDPPATVLIVDAEGVSDVDTTAIEQFGELLDDLAAAEIDFAMAFLCPTGYHRADSIHPAINIVFPSFILT